MATSDAPSGANTPVIRPALTLYGGGLSTFTRTIALSLYGHSIPFTHTKCAPHSDIAKQHHPLGLIPSLRHEPLQDVAAFDGTQTPIGGESGSSSGNLLVQAAMKRVGAGAGGAGGKGQGQGTVTIYESQAIARYLDAVIFPKYGKPSLRTPSTGEDDPVLHAKIDIISSLGGDSLFKRIEHGVIKPRLAAEKEGKGDEEIKKLVGKDVGKLEEVLNLFEEHLKEAENEERGGVIFLAGKGDNPTWADYYSYPPLADLKSVPEGEVLGSFPKLKAWVEMMENRKEAKDTYEGTVADKRESSAL